MGRLMVVNRSVAALLAVLTAGWLLGCEEKPAGPAGAKVDPCKDSCAKYAKCSLDLSKNMIRTILEGSGDDVRQTAFGYAAEDSKQITAQCEEQCSGAAKDQIAACGGKPTCVKRLACMAEALPVKQEDEKGPHMCQVEAPSQCVEYTGDKLKMSDVKPSCRALFEGKYSKGTCSKDDLVGTCEVGNKEAARTTYYYSTGKKPHTATSAKEACVGTFKPAAEAPAGSGSAASSAAPEASGSTAASAAPTASAAAAP